MYLDVREWYLASSSLPNSIIQAWGKVLFYKLWYEICDITFYYLSHFLKDFFDGTILKLFIEFASQHCFCILHPVSKSCI